MIRLLPLLLLAFNVWMVVDAHRRRAPQYWYFIILGVPLGAFAYLFLVKLKDFDTRSVGKLFEGPTSLAVLRKRYQSSPSTRNLVAWGQGLYDAREYREAAIRFEEVLARDPDNHDGLYGLGLAALQFDDFDRGIPALSRLVEQNPGYRDYAAWPDLALAFLEQGRPDHAVELVQDLLRKSPRINHKVLLGHVLQRAGREGEAREVLEGALMDHDDAATYVRRNNRPWIREAKKMLKEIEQASRRCR